VILNFVYNKENVGQFVPVCPFKWCRWQAVVMAVIDLQSPTRTFDIFVHHGGY